MLLSTLCGLPHQMVSLSPSLPYAAAGIAAELGTALLLWAITRSAIVPLAVIITLGRAWWLHERAVLMASAFPLVTCTAAWHLAIAAALFHWAFRSRAGIHPPHCCQACGYDMRGSAGVACPECGKAVLGTRNG